MDFIPYNKTYKDEIVKLLTYIWKCDIESCRLKFEQKYESNPYDSKIYAIIAIENNKIVGFRGFIPTRWKLKGKEIWILLVAEAVVHINYRRMGVFKGMTQKALDLHCKSKFVGYLNLSSNHKSARGNMQLGWKRFETKTYHRFTNLYKILLWKMGFSSNRKADNKDIKIANSVSDQEIEQSRCYQEVSHKMVLDNKYDYYKYKKLRNKNYLYFKLYKQNELVAYAAVEDDVQKTTIVDFEYKEVKYIKEIFRELKRCYYVTSVWEVSLIDLNIKDSILSKILRRVEKSKPPFLFRPIKKDYQSEDFLFEDVNLLNVRNWDLRNLYLE